MATTNDLKNGIVLNLDGQLWSVVEFQHVKPGKGGAFVRTKLKNVLSGKVVDKTFNAGVKVETATVDRREMQFLYEDGDDFIFMDGKTTTRCPSPPTWSVTMRNTCWRTTPPLSPPTRAPRCTSSSPPRSNCDHLHRARPAGRSLNRWHQARDAGDRRGDPGAAVHRTGHPVKVDTRDGSYLGRVN